MDFTFIGSIVALILTLMVYSYLIGDNPLFRIAEHLLVGVSVGFTTVTIIFNVIVPAVNRVRSAASEGNGVVVILYIVPLIAGIVLIFRPFRAARPVTNLVMALVIGVISALTLGGTLAGTLIPQVGATMLPLGNNNNGGTTVDIFTIVGNALLVICTLVTLWYFQFFLRKNDKEPATTNRTSVLMQRARQLGRYTIMLALGAVFASVFLTYIAALIDRFSFFIKFGS